jgi:hypothetical protein
MKFEIGVRGEQPVKEETAKVEFYLRKNTDGSVGLYIYNSAININNTNVQLLSIDTDGIIRRDDFSNVYIANAFMKYDVVGGYQRVRVQ